MQVTVMHSQNLKRASYTGLQTCGSVWNCPVCAAKISEQRRRELTRLIKRATSQGHQVLFLTKTISHQSTDPLHRTLTGLRDADVKFKRGNPYKRIRDSVGLIGTVTATEVSHGDNGWHPHTHELWILEKPISPAEHSLLLSKLLLRWINCCVRAGLPPPNERGLTLQDGTHANSYAAKWGLAEELSKSNAKKGRKESFSPFELLNVYLSSENKPAVQFAALLFSEYAREFKGRAQLRFSKGLKERFQIETPTDEELAEATDPDAEPLGHIEIEQWKIIRDREKRAELLNRLSSGDWSEFHRFMGELAGTEGGRCGPVRADPAGPASSPLIATNPTHPPEKTLKRSR
jgi:hypothetical protein